MLLPILLFATGLVCLIKGGDQFVEGSTGIARRFHLPELLIGATVVSIGTTLPEVMVSTTSALTGHSEIAYGNAIGSIICNTVLIAIGADLLVDNGTLIAQALGVPESVIALTFVALGTSLPELATAITSLLKGHGALSLGNVIGANFFNLVLVSGISVTLAPFHIPQSSTLFGHNASLVLELPVMFAVMLLLTLPPLIKGKLARAQGILLLLLYGAFCIVQFTL